MNPCLLRKGCVMVSDFMERLMFAVAMVWGLFVIGSCLLQAILG
jgi:hypothetical protein